MSAVEPKHYLCGSQLWVLLSIRIVPGKTSSSLNLLRSYSEHHLMDTGANSQELDAWVMVLYDMWCPCDHRTEGKRSGISPNPRESYSTYWSTCELLSAELLSWKWILISSSVASILTDTHSSTLSFTYQERRSQSDVLWQQGPSSREESKEILDQIGTMTTPVSSSDDDDDISK